MDPNVEVPSYFRCPISMELMRDPVTISTGMTYDRESIEHWFYTCNKKTCPATMQEIQNFDMTPNHTLRRLIQGWCVANSSKGVDRIPTPRPPVDSLQVSDLLQQAARSNPFQAIQALKKLNLLIRESQRNRRCIEAAGPGPILIPLLAKWCPEEIESENSKICEEALGILHLILLSQDSARLVSEPRAMRSLGLILQRGNSHARLHAAMLLQNVAVQRVDWEVIVRQNINVLHGLVEMLREEFSHQVTLSALDALKAMCKFSRRNKLRAVDAGLVFVLIQLLPEAEGPKAEKILDLLDKVIDCAEGRAAMADHAMGIAAVSKKMMRVSEFGRSKAVRILWSLCSFAPIASILRDMIQFGGVSKLCLVLQMEGGAKSKQKAKEVLKLHAKSWFNSPCFPLHLRNYVSM
ncbi:hypothetical protein SUGI_0018120 [Cryptomeria japonica]|uniref:RING-type E3 ubiquitin transferase n=1 Tax=Cryptomeria japonica TaxID=3369 RepID=A0A1V1FUY4_CRYJA|nr:E3 ubiquitin-protein ligase PUB23 [Cryptomeria japonica]BAX09102.1 U-box protein [Cryptomeria japonica]GLJ05431.1 hypothetical protein SUGI_0018120 [Cryptomeria japonica]